MIRKLAWILLPVMLTSFLTIIGCSSNADKTDKDAPAKSTVVPENVSMKIVTTSKAASITPVPRTGISPVVESISTVAPDILAVNIIEGQLERGKQVKYTKQPGDEFKEVIDNKNILTDVRVIREGKEIGSLVGGKDSKLIYLDEHVTGDKLQVELADLPECYRISSKDDTKYAGASSPKVVYRKSKPINMSEPEKKFIIRHTLYLQLSAKLSPGKSYTVDFGNINVKSATFEYVHNPEKNMSEAVHASQVGYRPDDPGKQAFLSIWLGTGGEYKYEKDTPFYLINDDTQKVAFQGKIAMAKGSIEYELPTGIKNYNLTNVYKMDFSEFKQPGRYRVAVEGVGCSYPFEISDRAWENAFKISMKGFYHNRSGIELGKPYTDYIRPRPYNPLDGLKVYQSTTSLLNSGNGLNAKGTDTDNFGNLIAGKTNKIVPNAWGGYFDAGDWDRRIQHLEATRYQLELLELYPDYFAKINLNIPESKNDLPDVLDEVLWNLDFYRRLQTKEGGIRGGIEAAAHPNPAVNSWQETLTVMAYAPDHWSSYIYAGMAARTAHILETIKPSLADTYRKSALRAMKWAEVEYGKWVNAPDAPKRTKYVTAEVNNERNLAAIELYRLTGDKKWHKIFTETSHITKGGSLFTWESHNNRNAAFVYATLDDKAADPAIKQNCIDGIIRDADDSIKYAESNAFNVTTPDMYRPIGFGYYSTPDAIQLIRAHFLTGKREYLDAIVKACQFGTGDNPLNMTYTTGVGSNYPKSPLHIDSRRSGQNPPAGITVYGNFDVANNSEHWMFKYFIRDLCTPLLDNWPYTEAFFDVYMFPEQDEWTINQTLGPNAYVWGYLAARK